VVDALERIYGALADGGILVDTQPISARPPVFSEDENLGTLDMTEWAKTIAAVDRQIMQTIERGIFAVSAEQHIVVTDAYDDLEELVETTSDWLGTRVPRALVRRVGTTKGAVRLDQDVRVRILSKQ
jgi:hypothetical protein